ncbi:MAG: pyruvate kinase [candidate division Zixibacteria bacterium HGW-Zixibacteria-1]|nr:MAG: pyruvate kinase [candidate division Zixibacteria bacterium HGW-Zixibacteria-1]
MAMTGIICTIGPSSDKDNMLGEMIEAGMNVARLNFSHGNHGDHQKRIDALGRLNRESAGNVRIMQDLEGFRIRIGSFEDRAADTIELKEKQIVFLSNQITKHDSDTIPLDYQGSLQVIKAGDFIYIDDGNIALRATNVTENSVQCEVVNPGILKEHKGVNIPDARFPFKGLAEKDRHDLEFGIKNKVDFIAQSFVRSRQDITDIRDFISKTNFSCQLIAKIENKDGIENLDEILDVADGIMVARGDLGVSLPIYEVPILQKMIIKKCEQRGKTVITATQMLESMTENLRPTRAEVSDVANAILDGSNYVMLSGETAVGKHPVETISMMKKIIDFTEQSQAPNKDIL